MNYIQVIKDVNSDKDNRQLKKHNQEQNTNPLVESSSFSMNELVFCMLHVDFRIIDVK